MFFFFILLHISRGTLEEQNYMGNQEYFFNVYIVMNSISNVGKVGVWFDLARLYMILLFDTLKRQEEIIICKYFFASHAKTVLKIQKSIKTNTLLNEHS